MFKSITVISEEEIIQNSCKSYCNLLKNIINDPDNPITVADIIYDNRKQYLTQSYYQKKYIEDKIFKKSMIRYNKEYGLNIPIVIIGECKQFFDIFDIANLTKYCYYDLTKIFIELLKYPQNDCISTSCLQSLWYLTKGKILGLSVRMNSIKYGVLHNYNELLWHKNATIRKQTCCNIGMFARHQLDDIMRTEIVPSLLSIISEDEDENNYNSANIVPEQKRTLISNHINSDISISERWNVRWYAFRTIVSILRSVNQEQIESILNMNAVNVFFNYLAQSLRTETKDGKHYGYVCMAIRCLQIMRNRDVIKWMKYILNDKEIIQRNGKIVSLMVMYLNNQTLEIITSSFE